MTSESSVIKNGIIRHSKKYFNNKSLSFFGFQFSAQKGLSLIELVVATGIFSVLVLMIFGMFSSSLRAQQAAVAQVRVEREAQLLLETLAKKIRSSRVDYTSYPGGTAGALETDLYLIDQTDTSVLFQYDNGSQAIDLSINGGVPSPLSSANISVTNLNFFIEPSSNPFIPGVAPLTQPRVTITMTLTATRGVSQATITLQQTVPQRGGIY